MTDSWWDEDPDVMYISPQDFNFLYGIHYPISQIVPTDIGGNLLLYDIEQIYWLTIDEWGMEPDEVNKLFGCGDFKTALRDIYEPMVWLTEEEDGV